MARLAHSHQALSLGVLPIYPIFSSTLGKAGKEERGGSCWRILGAGWTRPCLILTTTCKKWLSLICRWGNPGLLGYEGGRSLGLNSALPFPQLMIFFNYFRCCHPTMCIFSAYSIVLLLFFFGDLIYVFRIRTPFARPWDIWGCFLPRYLDGLGKTLKYSIQKAGGYIDTRYRMHGAKQIIE